MKRSDVPAKHALPFALNGSRNAIPESGAAAGIATLTSGFPDETMQPIIAGGIPPDGKDMNGVLFELSAMGRWANAGAEYAWDETFSDTVGGYPLGARLLGSDGQAVFISMRDNNTASPEAVSAAWVGYNPGRSSLVLTSGIRTLTALEAAGGMVVLTGTLTGNAQLVFPAWVRQWDVINQTTGAYTVTCRTDTGGVQVPQGYVTRLYGDGRILNAWAAREVAGMVKSITTGDNTHNPDEHGDIKLGSAADADIVTSMTDTTAERVPVVGWMGMGAVSGVNFTDGNTPNFNCIFRMDDKGIHGPIAGTPSNILQFQYDKNAGQQIGYRAGIENAPMYHRTKINGVWGNWAQVFDTQHPPTAAQSGALPNPGTLLTSIYDIAGSGIYAALGKGNEKPTEGMPDDSGNTRYSVLATEVYAGQYWVTLISKNEFYVGQVVISGKTANWCRYYNTGFKQTAVDAGALPITGGKLTGNLEINDNAPIIQLSEADTGKKYFIVADGSGFRIDEDSTAGNSILSYAGASKQMKTVGQFVPTDYTNFDNRYQAKGSYTPEGEAYTKAQSDARYPTGHRTGARTKITGLTSVGDWSSKIPQGAVNIASLTEGNDRITDAYYAYPQYLINGNWVNFA